MINAEWMKRCMHDKASNRPEVITSRRPGQWRAVSGVTQFYRFSLGIARFSGALRTHHWFLATGSRRFCGTLRVCAKPTLARD